jgi:hypothetical protein
MNNSAYSYVYRNIKEHLKIVLKRLGRGLGLISSSTIPRIDYIFADEK